MGTLQEEQLDLELGPTWWLETTPGRAPRQALDIVDEAVLLRLPERRLIERFLPLAAYLA